MVLLPVAVIGPVPKVVIPLTAPAFSVTPPMVFEPVAVIGPVPKVVMPLTAAVNVPPPAFSVTPPMVFEPVAVIGPVPKVVIPLTAPVNVAPPAFSVTPPIELEPAPAEMVVTPVSAPVMARVVTPETAPALIVTPPTVGLVSNTTLPVPVVPATVVPAILLTNVVDNVPVISPLRVEAEFSNDTVVVLLRYLITWLVLSYQTSPSVVVVGSVATPGILMLPRLVMRLAAARFRRPDSD